MSHDQAPFPPLPVRRLALITGLALAGAAVAFVAIVLPVEFGRDPLRTGALLGLNALTPAPAEEVIATPTGDSAPAKFYPAAYRSDVINIPLKTADAGEGGYELEYKVRMKAGDSLVYSWVVDGVTNPEEFYFDFHGHTLADPKTPAAKIQVMEYRQATGLSSNGVLIAPMDGVYGWFLQNSAAAPATVRLKVSGFYDLIPSGQEGNEAGILAESLKGK